MERKLTILIDMDDTIENLIVCWIKKLNERYGTTVQYSDVICWDMAKIFPTLTKDQIFEPLFDETFWDEVQPIEGSVEYIQKLIDDGHSVYIVTNSHYNTLKPKMEKVLLRYFPFISWRNVIIASNKQMIMGDILIDDAIHNLTGGEYIKFLMDAPHNHSFNAEENGMTRVHSWKEIYDLINNIIKEG